MPALFAALALAALSAAAAPTPETADQLFDKHRYEAALPLYEAQLKSADQETRLKALYRTVECEALLFRYLEAAARAEKAALPAQPLWRARLLLLRAEAQREAAAQYAGAAPTDAEQGSADNARRTAKEWREAASRSYAALYPLRAQLALAPLTNEAYFVETKDASLAETPSFWDLAASRWTDYLLERSREDASGTKPEALALLAPAYAPRWSPKDSPAAQAAALMEESSRLDGAGRALARELWRLRRAQIALDRPDLLTPPKDGSDTTAAAIALWRRWVDEFAQPGARAEAGERAAQRLNLQAKYADAVDLCKRLERDWPSERGSLRCAQLRARIELPVLTLSGKFAPPPGKGALRVNVRNLDAVRLRLYKTSVAELTGFARGRAAQDWSPLRSLDEQVLSYFAAKAPDYAWSAPSKAALPYGYADVAADPPAALAPGLYVALASADDQFAPKASMLSGVIVNVTELFMIATSGPSGSEADFVFDPAGPRARTAAGFHYYAVDALTGKPAAASLDAFTRANWGSVRRETARFDENGMAELPADFSLVWGENRGSSADALATSGPSLAFAQGSLWVSHSVPPPIQLFIDLDRPIYRPGQEVRGKVTVLRRLPRGFSAYAGAAKAALTVSDVNGQLVSSRTLTLDAYGTASFSAPVPAGRLLGRYSVSASLSDFGGGFSGFESFSVEEYKRPEFELTLSPAAGPARYGRAATVSGDAKYYFGGAVPDAPVTWRVVRHDWLPWFCWWWRPLGGSKEIASGQTRTDAQGHFSLVFTPQPSDPDARDPRPAEFQVIAEARDAGGRTITAERSYRAGAKAYLFAIEPPAGFLSAGAPTRIPVKLLNLDEHPAAGRGRFELRRLTGAPQDIPAEAQWWGGFPQAPSLETLYEKTADGPKAAEGTLEFSAAHATPLALPALAEGVYRLAVSADDPWGGRSEQKVVLLSVSAHPSRAALPLPSVAIPEHASYLPGETARLLVGSAGLDSGFLELWGGATLLERRALGGGPQLVGVRVGEDHKGGFTARWFGAKGFRIRAGEVSVAVPWADKDLTLSIAAPVAVKPGEKVSWKVSVKDRAGKPVDAQALVRVFDRSLEYYASQAQSWMGGLYARSGSPGSAQGSLFTPYARQIAVETGALADMIKRFREAIREPQPPRLRLNAGRLHGWGGRFGGLSAMGGGKMRMEMMDGGAMAIPAPAAASAAMAQGGGAAMGGAGGNLAMDKEVDLKKSKSAASAPPPPPVAVRSDFSETAYFEPRLAVRHGRAVAAFMMPERLTSWKIQAAALTRDAARGTVDAVTATKKDLMVRVEMPRFLREGDAGEFKAVVHNETSQELSGAVTLSVARDSAPAEGALGISELEKPFTIPAHGQRSASWKVQAPRGDGVFEVTAVARSGALADAERREIPLLPSRTRLIDSVLAALDGTTRKTLSLPAFFQKDPTRVNESMTLKLDPQLALSVLDSLPFLVHYPHECVEQVLDRYVPLSIVESFYRKDPRIAQAVAKIPRRNTLTRAWDRSDPRRLTQLMETPWEVASQGHYGGSDVVDLLDPALVERERADASAKLLAYQNSDGSYAWFPGGRGDPYMTLLVLAGWAEAQRYGVEVPIEAARRALAYVEGELPRHLKAEPGELSLTLFAAYVVTSFPQSLPEGKAGYALAKAWVDYADKHGDALTPLGRAYAALVYRKLGETAKSSDYLDRAMDGARRDPIVGVYWAPEKLSWLWFNDSVETHAFLLRTLLTLRPKDDRIPGMVQWLLFNRVGNEWKSTRASAAAIYSLLDVLRARGALDRGDSYTVSWGTQTLRASVEPLQWLEKPLRYTRQDSAIGAKDGRAVIDKSGPGLAFASLTWVYTTDAPAKASGPGLTDLARRYFKRVKDGASYTLQPLDSGAVVAVGDEVEVHLTVTSRSEFEYLHLKDPKLAGFEAEELTSGWKWDNLGRYEEPRDSLTNFFMSWLPHGEYVLRYRLRPTTPGRYRVGPAVLQSMYAPEITAHSDSFELEVR
jgi:uncharacterized protein YfaS (alpha-2-macroglobulin family)